MTDDKGVGKFAEGLQYATPVTLCLCATIIAVAALLSNSNDSVKIAFAGAAGSGLAGAAGLARTPQDKKSSQAVGDISTAENINVER